MPAHATIDAHLYIHTPTAIFKARLNLVSATYPLTTLPFDGVTLGAYGDIAPDATLILGSADGLDDYGRVRVQNVASATNIPVGRISQGLEDGSLNAVDNAYITVWNDFRVWAKLPYISPDGVAYKDSNVLVGDYLTTDMPPVANCGPGFAAYIDSVTSLITVAFDGTGSYAMADGATITGYAWDLQGGTVTVGTLTSATLTATFPAGFRWVGLTVTDSNGTPHSARCPVLAVNPAADATVENFQVESHRLTPQGQTLGFRILEDVLRTTYPDGTLVLFWHGTPSGPSDRTHMKFIGWHQSDSVSIRAQQTGLLRDTVLNCVDVAGRLAALPGFPQALERVTPATTWEHMPGLTMRKCLHYLGFWHSTAVSLADFILPVSLASYPAMRLDSTGASLYEQINSRCLSMVPDHIMACNYRGQLSVIPDWMLQDLADRPAIVDTLSEDDWGELRVEYNRLPRWHVLRASAVVSSTDWLVLGGEDTLPLAFCIAPGNSFGQGVSESTEAEGLTISQSALNASTGHRYARLNGRYGAWSIIKPDMDVWSIEPALLPRVQLNISATTSAQRGLDSATPIGQVKAIDLAYHHDVGGTWYTPTLTFEREVVGFAAVTHIPDVPDDPDYEVPEPPPGTTPPDSGLIGGQQLVAGVGIDGFIYRTSDFQTPSGSGGPTWTRVDTTIADTIYSFVVDPFSPGYEPGATTGAINGWIVNDTAIYRVTDLFGSATATSVFAFPTATSGAAFHWRSIQASFGAYFAEGVNPWLLCISYYGDTTGHTGTWCTRSTDGGVTWSAEVQVSAFYDQGIPTRFNPIGVYASPKTPGLGYTAAHIETGIAALCDGFVTTDWGATWSRVSSEPEDDPVEKQPLWFVWGDSATLLAEVLGPTASVQLSQDGAGGLLSQNRYINLYPPKDAVRVEVAVRWSWTKGRTGGTLTPSGTLVQSEPSNVTDTDAENFTSPTLIPSGADTDTTSGSYQETFTLGAVTNWTGNREAAEATPPTDQTSAAVRWRFNLIDDDFSTNYTFSSAVITVTVTEIELDGGLIYQPPVLGAGMIQPGHGQAGSIHLPWPDNASEQIAYYGSQDRATLREFRLKRTLGTAQTDVSPSAAGVTYGINRFGFAARAYDSDRQFVVASVVGNETTSAPADDKHGVYISSNAGNTWTQVVAPIADTNAPAGRAAFEAAFGGNSEQILFIWGPNVYISYSSNFGVAVDSRVGNLAALGLTTGLLGIAGGADAMSDRLKSAFKGAWQRIEEGQWIYGLLGRHNASGSVTFSVPGRATFVFVTIRTANGAQTVVPARNDAGVEHSADMPVRMKLEAGVYVLHGKSGRPDLATVPPTPPSGVPIHIHDDRYFREDEHVNVSAGAADAGKPVKLDAGGLLSNTFLDVELSSIAGLTSAADRLPYYTGLGTASLATFTAFARTILDDANAAAVLTTIGAQALDAELTALATLVSAADRLPYFTGSGTASLATFTAFARTFLDDADATTVRATLGLIIGTNVQAFDATLLSIALLGTAADRIAYTTGVDTWAETPLTAFGRSLIDDAAAVNARTTLGLVIGTDVQAQDAELAAIAGLTSAADRLPYFTGLGTAALATFTAFGRTLAALADAAAGRTALALGTIATQAENLYALLAGRAGGQTLYGGNAANDDLTIQATSHATITSAYVFVNPNGASTMIGSPEVPNTLFEVRGATGGETLTRDVDTVGAEPFILMRKGVTPVNLMQIRGLDGGGVRFTDGASVVEWMRFNNALPLIIGLTTSGASALGIIAGTSTNDAAVGGVLYSVATTVGNVTTGADVLATYTVPENTLAVNLQSLWFEAWGTTAGTGNSKTLSVNFGATQITALSVSFPSLITQWVLRGRIIRDGATNVRAYVQVTAYSASDDSSYVRNGVDSTVAVTLANANALQVIGEAVASNDIVLHSMIVGYDDANT